MELTKQDIQKIDNYLKKGIRYWDIRLEMIDHLASKLENEEDIEINSTLLNKEFGPIYNLNASVKSQIIQIKRKYRKLAFTSFLSFIKSFNFIIAFSLIILLEVYMFSKFESKQIVKVHYLGLIPLLIIILYNMLRNIKIKNYVLEFYSLLIIMPFLFLNFLNYPSLKFLEITAILKVGFILLGYVWIISNYKIYLKTHKEQTNIYKQYKSF